MRNASATCRGDLADHLARPPALWGWAALVAVLCAGAAVFVKNPRLAELSSFLALLCAGGVSAQAPPDTSKSGDAGNGQQSAPPSGQTPVPLPTVPSSLM